MAAKPPRPPGIVLTSQEASDSYKCYQKKRSDCACTNISIMQLFYEMKQKFPTVPDYVVNQYVFDNCHDRENCIKSLKQELILHPAQAYPSHALRNNQNLMCNKPLKPTRPAPSSPCDFKILLANNKSNNICVNDVRLQTNANDSKTSPQRPTTLNFHKPSRNNDYFSNNGNYRPPNRPVRVAPLPPNEKHPLENVQNLDQSFNSSLVQSPVSYSDSGESEISVNISLSPSSDQPRRTRRISAISIQPEPPYTRDFTPQSPRSFTSLNLTLRKPSITPQSPIDIIAGQGLTYSSSSFDARRGYQKNFHITVTDQGGVFSASRIRPRSDCTANLEDDYLSKDQDGNINIISMDQDTPQNLNMPVEQHITCLSSEQDRLQIVQRQRLKKENLVKALDINVKELEREQHEIQVLTAPLYPGESKRLDSIINELSGGCLEMLNIIERSGNASSNDIVSNYQANIQSNILRHPQLSTSWEPPHSIEHSVQDEIEPMLGQSPLLGPSGENEYPIITAVEGEPPWTCSMCTFQNHPLLNKCECCDNIRIIPGTLRILPSHINNSSPRFSRMSHNITSVNNDIESNDFNNTESYSSVIMSSPTQNCVMPGND